MPRLQLFVLVVAIPALCLVVSSAHAGNGSCYRHSKKDRLLAKKTNAPRTNVGVRKLSLDPHLSEWQSVRQQRWREGELSPTRPRLVPRHQLANARRNVGYAGGVKGVHRTFMGSPIHKATF